jgi:hypothetical protein
MTYLGWINSLGGVQYWLFTGRKDYNIDIYDSGDQTADIPQISTSGGSQDSRYI